MTPTKLGTVILERPRSSLIIEQALVAPAPFTFTYSARRSAAGTPASIALDMQHQHLWQYPHVAIAGWWYGTGGWTPLTHWTPLKMGKSPFHHPWVVVDSTGVPVLLPTDQMRPLHNPGHRARMWSAVRFGLDPAPADDLRDRLVVAVLPTDGIHPIPPDSIDAAGVALPAISRAVLALPVPVLAGLAGRTHRHSLATWAWYAARWLLRHANGRDIEQPTDLYRVLASQRPVRAFTTDAHDLYPALYALRQWHYERPYAARTVKSVLDHWHDT